MAQGIYFARVEEFYAWPAIHPMSQFIALEIHARVTWVSLGHEDSRPRRHGAGMYLPVYKKIWEESSGERWSSVHLMDGRLLRLGARLPALPVSRELPAPITAPRREVACQTEEIRWGWDLELMEMLGESFPACPESTTTPGAVKNLPLGDAPPAVSGASVPVEAAAAAAVLEQLAASPEPPRLYPPTSFADLIVIDEWGLPPVLSPFSPSGSAGSPTTQAHSVLSAQTPLHDEDVLTVHASDWTEL